ncbi:MAG: hypothetical protein PHH13_02575 [Candidatus Peribacteraceae bacterium]|nr:hypothetical protein [Candidatus Peribacteraceae bacterium]
MTNIERFKAGELAEQQDKARKTIERRIETLDWSTDSRKKVVGDVRSTIENRLPAEMRKGEGNLKKKSLLTKEGSETRKGELLKETPSSLVAATRTAVEKLDQSNPEKRLEQLKDLGRETLAKYDPQTLRENREAVQGPETQAA